MSGLPMKLPKTEPVAEFERMFFSGVAVRSDGHRGQAAEACHCCRFALFCCTGSEEAPRSPLADPRGARPNPW
eukprot:13185553-Alexandrium_andersonii.AAC.1